MEPAKTAEFIAVSRRYDPSANINAGGNWRDGCNVLFRGTDRVPVSWNGLGVALAGATGLGTDAGATSPFIDVAQQPGGVHTWVKMSVGSASPWRNNSLFFCAPSTTSVLWGGTNIGNAGPQLRVKLSGNPTPIDVGMLAPNVAPQLWISTETSQKLTGTRSMVVAEVNETTGWYSNQSPVSNIKTFLNQKAVLSFPNKRNASTTGWYVYPTPGGLATSQGFFRLGGVVPESSLGSVATTEGAKSRAIKLDFNDNELNYSAPGPVTKDPPPAAGTHVVAFDQTVVLCGTYGGAGLSPSDVESNGGSYDPLKTGYASPFENFTAIWVRPSSGFAMFSTKQSLQAIYVVGGQFIVAVRQYWGQDGIPGGKKSACFAGQTFFAYTDGGPAMLVGDNTSPEYAFALPVLDVMRRNFVATDVTVGWDPNDKCVVFCGQMSGGHADDALHAGRWVAFPYRLMDGEWGLPIWLGDAVRGSVTLNGKLYLNQGGSLVPWNTSGGGGLSGGFWCLRTDAVTFGSQGVRVRPRRWSLQANSPTVVARLYTNPKFTGTYNEITAGARYEFGAWGKLHPAKKSEFGIEFRGTAVGESPLALHVLGRIDPRRKR